MLRAKGSPTEPGKEPAKLVKLLPALPKAGLGPLFSSSEFWPDEAEAKAEEGVLPDGLEKVKFGPVPAPLDPWENVKEPRASGPLLTGWENVKEPGVTWL